MQALAEAATAYAQYESAAPHPDLENVKSGLLMAEPELSSATQLPEWFKTNPAYPVFGSTVKDKDNLKVKDSLKEMVNKHLLEENNQKRNF